MKLFASFMLLVALSITNASAATTTNPDPACALLVYRDVFQNLLTDWPEAGGLPRSPRFVFGKVDPITVEVRLKKQLPSPVVVEVINTTSFEQHDVNCDYVSYSNGWYIYRLRSTEYIYLIGSPPANPTGTTFGMVNEEVLHFTVKGSSPPCTQNWMVDRGERAGGGAVFYGGPIGDQTVCRFPQWYENGDHDFDMVNPTHDPKKVGIVDPANFPAVKAFINNAGENPSDGGQADILHWSSHGEYDGRLLDNNGIPSAPLFQPLKDGKTWDSDVEYVILAACSTLSNRTEWQPKTNYAVGNVVASVQYPLGTRPSGRYYECMSAGVSGDNNISTDGYLMGPQGVGFNIADGSALWKSVDNPGGIDSDSGFINWLPMTIAKHNVHGIFGAKHPLSGDLIVPMTNFYAQLTTGGDTYFKAFTSSMKAAGQPWAAIIDPHYQAGDRFKEVQQDGYQGHVLLRNE